MIRRPVSPQEMIAIVHAREYREGEAMLRWLRHPEQVPDPRVRERAAEIARSLIAYERMLLDLARGTHHAPVPRLPDAGEDLMQAYAVAHRETNASLQSLSDREWRRRVAGDGAGGRGTMPRGNILWTALKELRTFLDGLRATRTLRQV